MEDGTTLLSHVGDRDNGDDKGVAPPTCDFREDIARMRANDKAKGRGEYQFDEPPKQESNTWASMPCGVPGHDMTARAYGRLIQTEAGKGDFAQAEHYIREARTAGVLVRITLAVK
jgi:hypothetical protein